jgi:hypothetical protein
MMTKTYTWIKDAGHAWLKVSKPEYLLSGFEASRYSYQDDEYVYLEEDMDAPRYLTLYQPNPGHIPTEHHNGMSPVRNLEKLGDE